MALMASSIEMSFSLSRLRRTLRSMSIGPPPLPRVGGRAPPGAVAASGLARTPAEFHLRLPRALFAITALAVLAVELQGAPVRAGGAHPPLGVPTLPRGMRGRRRTGIAGAGERYPHQPAHDAAPVTRLCQRAVHAR